MSCLLRTILASSCATNDKSMVGAATAVEFLVATCFLFVDSLFSFGYFGFWTYEDQKRSSGSDNPSSGVFLMSPSVSRGALILSRQG